MIKISELIDRLIEIDPDLEIEVIDINGSGIKIEDIDIGIPAGGKRPVLYIETTGEVAEDDDCPNEVQAAIDLACGILDDLPELPEAAEDFVAGVEDKVTGILEWIENNNHVTENQKRDSRQPVVQRRLVVERFTVEVRGHPVTGLNHLFAGGRVPPLVDVPQRPAAQ